MIKPYVLELAEAVSARAIRFPLVLRPGRFALLTTVYSGTDAALFQETAGCLLDQTLPFDSWIVLAHGPVSPALDAILTGLDADPRIRILRRPTNLGIMGGMRVCLEAATTEYVVPMDADDLLTPDALQVLSAEIDRTGAPALLYSDEDILIEGVPQSPYWRPDWDPVLNLASSYIWHLCCIKREAALEAELYTDAGATWCHDWDTSFRLSRDGAVPLHIPEVLYHWRQHPASTSNSAIGQAEGSRRSTRHVLERFRSQQVQPSLYDIEDFPIFRGAAEWYLLRRPEAPPPITVIGLQGDPALPESIPATRQVGFGSPSRAGWWARWRAAPQPATARAAGALLQTLSAIEEPHVLLISNGVRPVGEGWWWEAAKLFEFHPAVALVCGVLTDPRDHVLRGAEVLDEGGQLACPQAGQPASAAGPFALWLKPQCVDAASTDFCFVETALLRETLAALPPDTSLRGLGLRLAAQARHAGRLVAWSPLIKAIAGPDPLDGPAKELPDLAARILNGAASVRVPGQRSRLARYLQKDLTAKAALCPPPLSLQQHVRARN